MEELYQFLQPFYHPLPKKQVISDRHGFNVITEDGRVYEGGQGRTPQTLLELPWPIRSISSRRNNTAVITSEGKVHNTEFPHEEILLKVPATSISIGYEMKLVLTLDGKVYKQTNDDLTLVELPLPAFHVCSTGYSYYIITIDGSVYAFGDNSCGGLGIGQPEHRNRLVPAKVLLDEPVISVTAGAVHCVLLTTSGTVYTCGGNADSQLGLGTKDVIDVVTPTICPLTAPCIAIASGGWHNFALLDNGKMYSWGDGGLGELGIDIVDTCHPTLVEFKGVVAGISAGSDHSVLLTTDGRLYGCGNVYGDGMRQSKFTEMG